MYKPNHTQVRIIDTINRIGQRVITGYSADQVDEVIIALSKAYVDQFDVETYKPRIRVSRGRMHEIKVYIDLPKIGTFKSSFSI